MKKRSISLMVLALAMTLVMYNCKKSDPLEPDQDLVKKINEIKVAPVTLVTPAAVTTTPATITASAKATEVSSALAGIASSGSVPASVTAATNDVKAGISTTEITTLSTISPATISAVSGGGALPADLKSIMDKAAANPALKAYLPTVTLPTVNGVAVSGGRKGSPIIETIAQSEGLEVSDECIAKAEEAYNTVKATLDATRASELQKVEAAYNTAIAPVAGELTSCTGGIPAKYAPLRTAAQTAYDKANADIEAGKAALQALGIYEVVKALNSIALLGNLSSINTLQAADLAACTAKSTASTTAAQAARTANTAAVEAAYQTALSAALKAKGELAQSCHNQG